MEFYSESFGIAEHQKTADQIGIQIDNERNDATVLKRVGQHTGKLLIILVGMFILDSQYYSAISIVSADNIWSTQWATQCATIGSGKRFKHLKLFGH